MKDEIAMKEDLKGWQNTNDYYTLPITHYTLVDVSYGNNEITTPLIPIHLLPV